jgi:serine/threonine-protein kinase
MSNDDAKNRGDGIPELIEGRAESEALIVNPLIGKLLNDRFRVETKVGEGGFGAVYRGTDVVTGRRVAIKFLLHTIGKRARTALARFQREAAITGRLNHPFIITIYDSGIFEHCPYIVMEWVEGETLAGLVKRGPVEWRTLIKILRDVASALTHAAANGVVHRDMKPDNVMIRASTGTAVVLDFGIAATYRQDEQGLSVTRQDRITSLGLIMGTPDYISPESWAGEKALDGRADVYALGAMIFQALEGRTMWGIVPSGPNDIPAFSVLADCAQSKPRPLLTAPVPDGVKVLYTLSTVADRNERPWPEGFLRACEELLASDGASITLDSRSKTLSARVLSDGFRSRPAPAPSATIRAVAPTTLPIAAQSGTNTTPPKRRARRGIVVGGALTVVVLCTSIVVTALWMRGEKPKSAARSTAETNHRSIGAPSADNHQVASAHAEPTDPQLVAPPVPSRSPSVTRGSATTPRKRRHSTSETPPDAPRSRATSSSSREKPLPTDDGIFD